MRYRLICFLALFSTSSFSQVDDRLAAERVRLMGRELLMISKVPGISIAITKNGKLVFAEGFGHADPERRIPIDTSTRFRTASVAKVITATALARLIQDGRLDLGSPVQHYIPEFPIKAFPITVRDLAGHVSGLPHYNSSDSIEDIFYSDVIHALKVFAHQDQTFEPRTKYSYSTHNFTLLSAVIERASKDEFLGYLQKQVLSPLRMTGTGPDLRPFHKVAGASDLFSPGDSGYHAVAPEPTSYKWGAGGMLSTPSDLTRLGNAYLNGFLEKRVVDTMFSAQKLRSGEDTRVGIAWRISRDIDGRPVIEHAGFMRGARSVVCIFPEEKIVIAIMTNADWSSSIEETAHMLARPFLVPAGPLPARRKTMNASVTAINGKGESTRSDAVLTLNGGKGTIRIEGKDNLSVVYLDHQRYALIRPDGIYYMRVDDHGNKFSGQAIAYGSRLASSPESNPPFFVLETRD